jgi:UDP-GlcNAc3NAcA epimerase
MPASELKILTVVGARPQFVKAAVVSRAISAANARRPRAIAEVIVHTGQHYDPNMSDVFFEEMHIPRPGHHLGIGGGSHGAMTGQMLEAIERVAQQEAPDWMLVYGDTNSTMAGALAAAKLHIPVAHVEAGLRSFNRKMPEEINRVVTDHVADFLFAPTDAAVKNLELEGISGNSVRKVGDVMFDAALFYRDLARLSDTTGRVLARLSQVFHLATVHRAENTDDQGRLTSIIRALEEISSRVPVVLPLHPRTRKLLGEWRPSANLHVLQPVGYFDMLYLLQRCRGVLTDSGGLQKEAFFFGKPCVVLRDETEWVELVEQGFNLLVGAEQQKIVAAADGFLRRDAQKFVPLFGDGHAGEQIVGALVRRQ